MIRNADDIVDSLRIYVIRLKEKPRTIRAAITAKYALVCMCLWITCWLSNVGCCHQKKLQTELNRTKQSKTRELMIKTHELNAKQRCEYAESNGKKWYNGLYGMIFASIAAADSFTHFLQKEPPTMRLMCIKSIICVSLHVFIHLNIRCTRCITRKMTQHYRLIYGSTW